MFTNLSYNVFTNLPFLKTLHLNFCFDGFLQYNLLLVISSKNNNESFFVNLNKLYHNPPKITPVNPPNMTLNVLAQF